jgi:hypothetical protein
MDDWDKEWKISSIETEPSSHPIPKVYDIDEE